MEYLSEIVCGIIGLFSGITATLSYQKLTMKIDNSSKDHTSYSAEQNNNKADKVIGRDDNSRN